VQPGRQGCCAGDEADGGAREEQQPPAPDIADRGIVPGTIDWVVAHTGKLAGDVQRLAVPAWRASTEGEHRWMVTLAVAVAIGLQLTLPRRLVLPPWWLLPALGAGLLVGLVTVNPTHINRMSSPVRAVSIALTIVLSLANAVSAIRLIARVLEGRFGTTAGPLLLSGGAIWVTNVIVFGLWYWELDRGGPAARAHGIDDHPDFLFPQMTSPDLAPPGWEPRFVDYLYVSFTNATAFSPTDVVPMAGWVKMTMMLQSAISLSTVALVIARAVNILK
jgi:hypothetical protein